MLEILETFFANYGYAAVFSILVLCGFGLPIPEDITLVAGGVISGLGEANLYIMIVVGLAGVILGDGLMFSAGYFLGPKILKFRWINKLLTPKRYIKVQQKFDRYGNSVIFVARFLPGLRTPIYITAGMSKKISYLKFFIMDGVAALISVPAWIIVGHYSAANRELLLSIIKNFKLAIFTVLAILFTIIFINFRKKHKRRKKQKD